MPEERVNPQPQNEEGAPENEASNSSPEESFTSDTQKLVRKHLEDKDHVITDEDIANIRVGMVPPEFDAATEIRFEDEEAREKTEDRILGDKKSNEDDNLANKRITPWDAIDPQ